MKRSPAFPPPEKLFGIPLVPVSPAGAVDRCGDWVRSRRRGFICLANAHVLVESVFNPALRRALLGAAAVMPDGMPLAWFLRSRGYSQARVYGPDLMLGMVALSARRHWRIFLYGSTGRTLARLRTRLSSRFRALKVCGQLVPPFRERMTDAELAGDVRAINRARPDIVFVGLGAPKQEVWMRRARPRLKAPLLFGVGAAFDFHAGTKPQAPRWMMGAGLEWLFRLATEPGRLWKRYLVTNSLFLLFIALQALGKRRWGASS